MKKRSKKIDIASFGESEVIVNFLRTGTLNGFSVGDPEETIYLKLKKRDIEKIELFEGYAIRFGDVELLVSLGNIVAISIELHCRDVKITDKVSIGQHSSFDQVRTILDIIGIEWTISKNGTYDKFFTITTKSGILFTFGEC